MGYKSFRHSGPVISALQEDAVKRILGTVPIQPSGSVSHLADIAIRLKRKVQWDPVKETILDDPEAARLLSRPMREPWSLS
ncbi:MAG: hypothetical protein ABR915_13980 [Thermoguttaceae bacterium]|jgi:hypothetical protein